MGHAINIYTFPEDVDPPVVQECADEWCRCNCDPWEHGGDALHVTADPVRWKRGLAVFPDLEAAEDYLCSGARPAYETWAVRFRSDGEPSKRTMKIEERLARLEGELESLRSSTLPAKRKSALIGCAACGSKLSREHLGVRDCCPVCGAPLRSKTDLERIAAKGKAVAAAEGALRESRAKDGERAPLLWAVIAEVHC